MEMEFIPLNTLEDMDMPCPEDICDGSGLVEKIGYDGYEKLVKCPCKKDPWASEPSE